MRLLEITESGMEKLRQALPYWKAAQKRVMAGLGAPLSDAMLKAFADIVAISRETAG